MKNLIQQIDGFPIEQQCLIYKGNELNDSLPIMKYDIKDGETINLIQKNILFKVLYLGVEIEFFDKPNMTVKQIKEEIHEKQGIEVEKQLLLLNKNILEDDKVIGSYGIKNGSAIELEIKKNEEIQIFIKTFQSKVIAISAKELDTIGDIKSKIQEKSGISKYNQRLIIFAKELLDHKTIKDYQIRNNGTIHLVLKENKNECILIYKIKKGKNNFRIIGENFYQNNATNCIIEINGKESKLYEFQEIKANENNDNIIIKLIKTNEITDMSYMFCECSSLVNIDNIHKWNTIKVTKMNNMFSGCKSLISLPDISDWNISEVKNLNYMFSGCVSLQKLPNISKWNTKNVTSLRGIFSQCKSLVSIPDISKWDTSNVNDISFMFSECTVLSSIPDLSNWNINKVIYMASMFSKCLSLISLPDLSKWDISNVKYMAYMFEGCSSLQGFPDISNWDFSNVKDYRFMFKDCQKNYLEECRNDFKLYSIRNEDLKYLPQIELKFNEVNKITSDIIDDLKMEIENILNENNFSIIEIKKGSLTVLLVLQFLIFKELQVLKKNKIKEFDPISFSNKFSEKIKFEVQKIAKILGESDFITFGKAKPNNVEVNIIEVNKEIVKKAVNEKEKNLETQSSISESNSNLYELSKNISIDDLTQFYSNLTKNAEKQELNQKKLIDKLDEFNKIVDITIEKAIKESIFEYKINNIYLVDRDVENYNKEKEKCPNKIELILFHGTAIDCGKSILASQFRDSKSHFFGIGAYFTDMLDYAWRYSKKDTRVNSIPKKGELFSFVTSEIYYDSTKKDVVYDTEKKNEVVCKYGIRCGFGNFKGYKLKEKDVKNAKNLVGTEYLISDKNQILPLYCITVKRIEYLVIWRDYNFIKNNPNKYSGKTFNKIQEFHKLFKKKITKEFDSKIYYSSSSEEALDLIKRKKNNKIIILTNGNNKAKDFITQARTIIGNNTIVAVSVYDIKKHYKWIKEMQNTILLNGIEYHEKFFNGIMNNDIEYLFNLRDEIINDYKKSIADFTLGKFDNNILEFPLYKTEGKISDINIDL